MGMIRVSDHAEQLIREHSNGRTITATVDAILAGSVAPDETEMWKGERVMGEEQSTIIGKLDYLESYLDKKFERLESLITDTAVDRVATGGGRAPGGKEWVPWDQMQYIIFTHEDDDPAWIIPEGAVFQFKNGDPTAYAYFVKDNVIFMESVGRPEPLLSVTPEIREAIDKHFTYAD